jgi:predicted phosphodiesterase
MTRSNPSACSAAAVDSSPPECWKQLMLPFGPEPICWESFDELIEECLTSSPPGGLSVAMDPSHMLCSRQSTADLAAAVELRLGSDELQRRNRTVLKLLSEAGGRVRRLRRLPDGWRANLDSLERSFPNFANVISHVRAMGALAELGDGVVRLDAIVLDGPPGTGKSTFAEGLGEAISGSFVRVAMSAAESGAQLGGSATSWSNSQTGLVFDCLFTGTYANPMVLLDELDKAPTQEGQRHSPIGPLYQLLEPSMARAFRDLSLPMLPIDTSAITWVATTNTRRWLPEPILSRLLPFDIGLPQPDQAVQMVNSVMRGLALAEPALARFKLSAGAAAALAMHTPRAVRGFLRRARVPVPLRRPDGRSTCRICPNAAPGDRPWAFTRKSGSGQGIMDDIRILFCGDPHSRFDHILRAAKVFASSPVVLLGDLEPQRDLLEELGPIADRLWWIHGNHDTDQEAVAQRVWDDRVARHSIHARVETLAGGLRLAGLGGVFRESVWHPDPGAARGGQPAFASPQEHARATPQKDRWRGGPHRRHWSSIYPLDVDRLAAQRCDVLVLHEAPGYHPHGFGELDILARAMGAKVVVHGHHHDCLDSADRWDLQGFKSFGVGLRGITAIDVSGNAEVLVAGELACHVTPQ